MEKLTDKQKKLIEEHYGYVGWWMSKVGAPLDDYDMYLEVLCNAAKHWDEARADFCPYLDVCLKNKRYMQMYNDKETKTHRKTPFELRTVNIVSLQEESRSEGDGTYTLEEILPDKRDSFDTIETKISWDRFKKKQKPINQDILHDLELGKTQTEIAKKFGVSREAISRRVINMKRNYKRFAQVK